MATYVTDNWRAFRTWGVSAFNSWEYSGFWKQREGVARRRTDVNVDWDRLQRPGFSPDYNDRQRGGPICPTWSRTWRGRP